MKGILRFNLNKNWFAHPFARKYICIIQGKAENGEKSVTSNLNRNERFPSGDSLNYIISQFSSVFFSMIFTRLNNSILFFQNIFLDIF